MPLLAVDDTDTREGGCTTRTGLALATVIERAGGALSGWGLIDVPRLVRLCPAVPWKTRGNGAVVLPVGERAGKDGQQIGHDGDTLLGLGRPSGDEVPDSAVEALKEIVADLLPEPAEGDADPQPGAVLLPHAPDVSLYHAAVATVITPDSAWRAAPEGTLRLTERPGRGEIGALAAAAWPMTRYTWEWIAYRDDADRRPGRDLSREVVEGLLATRRAFDDRDAATGRLRMVPRTPCPVLYGLRGTDPHTILDKVTALDDGRHGGLLFRTNQATGDHAAHASDQPTPWSVVRTGVTVTAHPERRAGGHLFVRAETDGASLLLAAFEPTKGLRDVLDRTMPGDRLEVLARTGRDATTLRLEAFRPLTLVPRTRSMPNPRCPVCGRAMKSAGHGAGYRCRPCGERADATVVGVRESVLILGSLYQVPDHVRGHLLPPLEGLPAARPLAGEKAGLPVAPVLSDGPVLLA
ncbi:MAG: DUF1743 domain-containing protein [Euryarchaeota archaeon]|nr:DUF1743 domain-containing protein [Euryarchaeota archaeon]